MWRTRFSCLHIIGEHFVCDVFGLAIHCWHCARTILNAVLIFIDVCFDLISVFWTLVKLRIWIWKVIPFGGGSTQPHLHWILLRKSLCWTITTPSTLARPFGKAISNIPNRTKTCQCCCNSLHLTCFWRATKLTNRWILQCPNSKRKPRWLHSWNSSTAACIRWCCCRITGCTLIEAIITKALPEVVHLFRVVLKKRELVLRSRVPDLVRGVLESVLLRKKVSLRLCII